MCQSTCMLLMSVSEKRGGEKRSVVNVQGEKRVEIRSMSVGNET